MLSDPLSAIESQLLSFLSNSGCYEPSKYAFEEVYYLSPDMATYFMNGLLGVKGWYKQKVHEHKVITYFAQQVLDDSFSQPSLAVSTIDKADASLYQYVIWQSLKASFSAALIQAQGKPDLLIAFDKTKQNDNVLYYYDNDQILKPLNIKKMREAGYKVIFDNKAIATSLKGMLKFRRQQLAKVSVIVAREIYRPNSRKKINIPKIA